MASTAALIGTGVAVAGLGGFAAAAVTVNPPDAAPAAQTSSQPVETQTVVVRTVEHRVQRVKARHRRHPATVVPTPAPAVQAAPVVQATPVRVAATPAPAPIRTRASGGSGHGGDDGAEHESEHNGGDDRAEHADD
jgi:hypothetical protein